MFLWFYLMFGCSEADFFFFPELLSLLQFLAVPLYYCDFGSLINYFRTLSPVVMLTAHLFTSGLTVFLLSGSGELNSLGMPEKRT